MKEFVFDCIIDARIKVSARDLDEAQDKLEDILTSISSFSKVELNNLECIDTIEDAYDADLVDEELAWHNDVA